MVNRYKKEIYDRLTKEQDKMKSILDGSSLHSCDVCMFEEECSHKIMRSLDRLNYNYHEQLSKYHKRFICPIYEHRDDDSAYGETYPKRIVECANFAVAAMPNVRTEFKDIPLDKIQKIDPYCSMWLSCDPCFSDMMKLGKIESVTHECITISTYNPIVEELIKEDKLTIYLILSKSSGLSFHKTYHVDRVDAFIKDKDSSKG